MDDQLPPPPTDWEMWQIASPGRKAVLIILLVAGAVMFPLLIFFYIGVFTYYRRKHKRIVRERGK